MIENIKVEMAKDLYMVVFGGVNWIDTWVVQSGYTTVLLTHQRMGDDSTNTQTRLDSDVFVARAIQHIDKFYANNIAWNDFRSIVDWVNSTNIMLKEYYNGQV